MLWFALGGVVLSSAMALGTYVAAREYLIEQRERSALRQAFSDAARVRDGLLTSGAEVSDVLGAVSPPADAAIVLRRGDRWYTTSLAAGEADIPAAARDAALEGSTSITWQRWDGTPGVVVRVPLREVNAEFFELAATTELDRTLDILRVLLVLFAAVTAVSLALVGRWAARRVVRPLDRVAGAAARIASGALDTRLPATDDPDLVTIVASFNSMVDAINERIERDMRFAADVSHELRSPLTTLVTSVDLLDRHRDEFSARSQNALQLIQRDLSRFQRALQDLLDLGRLEAGAAQLVPTAVDARELIRQALVTTGHDAGLLVGGEREVATVMRVDKSAMHRAIVNLVENADRHGGGLTGVTVDSVQGAVVIAVRDRGPGVPVKDRERIFQRFARGGSRQALPGAGLGLSLVMETVRAHGGSVQCLDNEGSGASFTIRLPADVAPTEGA